MANLPLSQETDGRFRRSERTRQHLIETYLDLLKENPKRPTADELAKRAGCSERSVFERFSDLQTLSLAAVDYALHQASAQAVVRNVDGDRLSRIRSQVETRAETCERWLPLWRTLLHTQHDSEELPRRIECTRDTMLARLELMYRPELSTLSAGERKEVLIALEALTDFEAWGRMRQRHGLSVEAAREVWINTIGRILPPTPCAERQADAAIESPAEAGVT